MNNINKTILLVEDEAITAKLGVKTLQKYGYDVIHADTGEKAIEIVESIPGIDLILMDIDLGDGLDGTETAEQILKQRDISLVFLSSHTEPEVVEKTEGITSYGYIVKNSGETVLLASIKMAFKLFDAHIKNKNYSQNLEKINKELIRSENELKESEERYKSIISVSNTGAWEYHYDADYLWCSPEYFTMLGRDPDDFRMDGSANLNEVWTNLIHPNDRDKASELFSEYISTGSNGMYENYFRMMHADGSWVWIWSRGQTLKNCDDTLSNLTVGTHIDVTELKVAEVIIRYKNNELINLNEELAAMNEEFEAANDELIEKNHLLESSEVKYRLLFDNSPHGLLHFNTEGILTDCNNNFVSTIGSSHAALIGMNILDLPDKELTSAIGKALSGSYGYYEGNYRSVTAGKESIVRAIFTPVFSGCGNLFGGLGIIEDITEKKQIEKALYEGEKMYRLLAENASDVIWTMDINAKYLYVSPSVVNLRGVTPEENMNEAIEDSLTPESARIAVELFIDAVTSIKSNIKPVPKTVKLEQKCKNGSTVWTEVSVNAVYEEESGDFKYFVGITRDITERIKIEESLRESEEQYRTLVENLNEIIYRLDDKAVIVYVSPNLESLTGYRPEDVIGRNFVEFVHPDDVHGRIEQYNKIMSGITEATEYRFIDKNGGVVWVRTNARSIYEEGKITGLQGVLTDITDLKEAEEEILKINSAKSMFLAKMSHEIRTPLSSITGIIDLVLMTDDDMERLDYLTTIKQSSSHLISIINDLLDFSRIESGALQLESVPFNPVREINNSTSIFLHACMEKDIYLIFNSDEISDEYIVSGDPTRFRQVLINIIGNAVKFTETGGIEVRSQYVYEERTDRSKGIIIVVEISDTGPGIDKDKQDIIFDNYVQSDPNIAGNYGGTGLGLAISRELVEKMGGSIGVESEPGKGSIFTVTIPFKLTDNNYNSGSIADKYSKDRSNNITYSVLVAEDDRISLKIIKILLGKYGHNVVSATNGKEVIELLSKHKVDIILLDIEMPVMDGLETAARIRNGEAGKEKASIPIIALTAHNSSQIGEKCKSAGIDEVLSKPFKIEQFTPFIADLIELKKNK